MVKITDGNTIKEVTRGMFDNLFSSMGYKLVEEKSESKSVKEVKPVKENKKEEVKEVPEKEVPKTSK